MLKSMTGFGRGEGETALGKLSLEIRSINHRYCDINMKLPKRLAIFEPRLKELVRSEVMRGRVDVSVRLDSTGEAKVQLNVDLRLAQQYYEVLQALKEKLHLQGEISLELLAGLKDVITGKEEQEDVEPYWMQIAQILRQALREMDHMKRTEGAALSKDIQERLDRIGEVIRSVQHRFPGSLEAYCDRLHERIKALLLGGGLDSSRLQQEIALLAERMDITEETVRIESHLGQFASLLKADDPVGRKLDFLLQEIHREVNTLSAKANDAEISQRVVEMKSELEKVREQVQNIE